MSDIKRAVALGFFDGVHIGHAALLNKTKERAAQIGAQPSVMSFDVHPDTLVFGTEVPLITGAADREEIIHRCFGIDNVVFLHFNLSMMHMPWQEFAENIINELNVGWMVVGHDFRFGDKGAGTAKGLKEYCEARGIGCDIIDAVTLDGERVSSTHIRQLMLDGKMGDANRFLGHPHSLSDTIRSGYHLGTKMGTPTINMFFPEGVLIPKHGVYAAKVYLSDGSVYNAVTNIGVRPTVSDEKRVSVESHLLNYSGNLYGKHARVEFYEFMRPERRFENFEELSAQIKRDAENTRVYFEERD